MLIPDKPQTISQVVKTGVSLWKTTLKLTLPFGFIFGILCSGFNFILSLGTPPDEALSTASNLKVEDLGLLIAYSVISLIIILIIYAATIIRINHATQGNSLEFGDAIRLGFQKAFRLALVMLLSICAVGMGYILLIIPGIILSIYLLFSSYIVVLEEKGAIASIRESVRLVSGNWWNVAGTFLLMGIIYIIFNFILSFIAIGLDFFFLMIAKVLFSGASKVFKDYVVLITSGLVASILYPFYHTCTIAMYYDLRLKKSLTSSSNTTPTTLP